MSKEERKKKFRIFYRFQSFIRIQCRNEVQEEGGDKISTEIRKEI